MGREIQRGQKVRLTDLTAGTDLYIGVVLDAPGLSFDITLFGLDAQEKMVGDDWFIFFNNATSPDGSVQQLGAQAGDNESFRVTLDKVPPQIDRLAFVGTVDGAGTMAQLTSGYLRIVAGGEEVGRYSVTGRDFTNENTVMLGEFYRRDGWRFTAIGQGFAGGLADVVRHYGGEVDDEEPAPEPASAGGAPGFAPPAAPAGPPGFAPPAGGAAPPAAPASPPPAPGFGPPPAPAGPPPAPPGPPPAPPGPPPAPPGPPQAPAAAYPPAPPGPPQAPAAAYPPAPPGPPQAPGGYPPAPPGPPQAPGGYPPAPPGPPGGGYSGGGYPGSGAPVPQAPTPGLVPLDEFKERPASGQRWLSQNSKLVKVTLQNTEVLAKRGAMVAYQGQVEFDYEGGGLSRKIRGKLTGQGMQLMRCSGNGEVFLADEASDLHVIELQGDSLTVSAKQVLAFDADLTFDEQRLDGVGIQGGAMYVLAFSGQGSVVVMTKGTPVVLNCDAPTFADTNAVVAWSSSMRVTVASAVRLQQMHWATGPTGETYTLQMLGMPGQFVIVQPYEV